MGKLFLKDEVVFFTIWALMVSYSSAEKEFFYQPEGRSWDEARNHCQVCFKDLVTLTPENIQAIIKKVTSESWVGLRKTFYTISNFTSNNTVPENTNCTSDSSGNFTSNCSSNCSSNSTGDFSSNSTVSISVPWSRWANGDPLSFQNWYPGWPIMNSSLPKRYCCSCSCTCPQSTTNSGTTQKVTTQRTTDATWSTNDATQEATSFSWLEGNGTESVMVVSSFTNIGTDQQTDFSNITEDSTTSQPPIQAECVRSPMLEHPEVDENYTEDSCVAMLSFGAWVEKECSTLLPFICYEERFSGRADVSNVTSSSAVLTWEQGPGDISHYRVEVSGQNVTLERTNLTLNLENLIAGSHYSVKVFAVKCERDLNPQEANFYTTPNKVLNLAVANETETSISLIWTKPDGNADRYVTKLEEQGIKIDTETESSVVEGLIPGNLYTFTVLSGVEDRSRWSEASEISAYTRPGEVSDLKVSHISTSLLLTWKRPEGNSTTFSVTAVDRDTNISHFEVVVNQTEVKVTSLPRGRRITLGVRAVVNNTLMGDEVTVNTITAPAPITHLTLTSGQDYISASWQPPNGTRPSFIVTLQHDGIDQVTEPNITEPNVDFQGLTSGASYTVIVYAVSGLLKSPPVRATKFTLPIPPSNLNVTAFGKDTITLAWKAPISGSEFNYTVHITSSFWKDSEEKQVNKTSYKFEGLKSGTNYTMSVRTMVDQNESSAAILTHFTKAEARELSLSMLCSSAEPLLCEGAGSRESILTKLKEEIEKRLGDMVYWKFEW